MHGTRMDMVTLPVGQGLCTLIEVYGYLDDPAKEGLVNLILFDCGTSGGAGSIPVDDCISYICQKTRERMQFLNSEDRGYYIDYLFLSHQDRDHVNLIPKLLTAMDVDTKYSDQEPGHTRFEQYRLEDGAAFREIWDTEYYDYDNTRIKSTKNLSSHISRKGRTPYHEINYRRFYQSGETLTSAEKGLVVFDWDGNATYSETIIFDMEAETISFESKGVGKLPCREKYGKKDGSWLKQGDSWGSWEAIAGDHNTEAYDELKAVWKEQVNEIYENSKKTVSSSTDFEVASVYLGGDCKLVCDEYKETINRLRILLPLRKRFKRLTGQGYQNLTQCWKDDRDIDDFDVRLILCMDHPELLEAVDMSKMQPDLVKNGTGAIITIQLGAHRIMLSGDAIAGSMLKAADVDDPDVKGDYTAIQVPHHGAGRTSRNTTPARGKIVWDPSLNDSIKRDWSILIGYLNTYAPLASVYSFGFTNCDGHPNSTVIFAVEQEAKAGGVSWPDPHNLYANMTFWGKPKGRSIFQLKLNRKQISTVAIKGGKINYRTVICRMNVGEAPVLLYGGDGYPAGEIGDDDLALITW